MRPVNNSTIVALSALIATLATGCCPVHFDQPKADQLANSYRVTREVPGYADFFVVLQNGEWMRGSNSTSGTEGVTREKPTTICGITRSSTRRAISQFGPDGLFYSINGVERHFDGAYEQYVSAVWPDGSFATWFGNGGNYFPSVNQAGTHVTVEGNTELWRENTQRNEMTTPSGRIGVYTNYYDARPMQHWLLDPHTGKTQALPDGNYRIEIASDTVAIARKSDGRRIIIWLDGSNKVEPSDLPDSIRLYATSPTDPLLFGGEYVINTHSGTPITYRVGGSINHLSPTLTGGTQNAGWVSGFTSWGQPIGAVYQQGNGTLQGLQCGFWQTGGFRSAQSLLPKGSTEQVEEILSADRDHIIVWTVSSLTRDEQCVILTPVH